MTDRLRAAAQAALEAIQELEYSNSTAVGDKIARDAKKALRAALAEREAEPVMWSHNLIPDNVIRHRPADIDRHPERWTALYAHPPCREWQALTDKEVAQIVSNWRMLNSYDKTLDLARYIEAALKEKNHD